VVLALASAPDARAAPPQYTMEEIEIIGFQPDADGQGRFGINERGEIAFTKLGEGVYHAMLFLPQSAYGMSAGVHDLAEEIVDASQDPILTGHSYARDIGDEGFAVGQFEGTEPGAGKAFVIDLADVLSLTDRVFVYEGVTTDECTEAWSRAMAVSNNLDPSVVIETGRETNCVLSGCQAGGLDCFVSGATLSSIGSGPVLEEFDVVTCRTGSRAVDIVREDTVSPPLLAGWGDILVRAGGCTTSGLPCDDSVIPIRWDPSLAVLGNLGTSQARPAAARGINFAEYAVGYGYTQGSGGADCQRHAILWPPGSPPDATDLHAQVDEIAVLSRAESINRCENLQQAVGWDPAGGQPLLWIRPSGGWEGWLLQVGSGAGSVEIECGGCEENVFLKQAFDVNDDGLIIAWGQDSTDDEFRLYLLTPVDQCDRPGDVDNNGDVGTADLLLVLSAWGDCTCPWCPEDIDGNGTVGFSYDLLLVLSNWGPCDGEPLGLPKDVEDCIERVGYDPVAHAACIAGIE
jgi:hypothetical protein